MPLISRNRPGSAGARHNLLRTADGAELRQGTRSVCVRQYPSHRRRIRRSAHYGNRGRIHRRHWPRRRLRGCRRTEPPRKGFSMFPPWLSRPRDRPLEKEMGCGPRIRNSAIGRFFSDRERMNANPRARCARVRSSLAPSFNERGELRSVELSHRRQHRYPDQRSRQDSRDRDSVLGPAGSHSKSEAVSAFPRGAHGSIHGRGNRIWRA
jgi:hypothetical protein